MAVDEWYGVISRDSAPLPSTVEPLCQRLLAHDLPVAAVVADTNYSNALNYALLEA